MRKGRYKGATRLKYEREGEYMDGGMKGATKTTVEVEI